MEYIYHLRRKYFSKIIYQMETIMNQNTNDPKKATTGNPPKATIAMDGSFLTEGLVKKGGLISTFSTLPIAKPAAPPAQKPQQTGTQNTQQSNVQSNANSNNKK
jgi:hypothetical protein